MRNHIDDNELYHYGVKGMKWGARRYQNKDGSLTAAGKKRQTRQERKQVKKNVNKLYKGLTRSRTGGELVSMATLSKFDKTQYKQLADAISKGRLITDGRFVKNYKEQSVDIYVGGQKTPTIRARLRDGENFSAKFLDENENANYSEFAKYYEENHR